MCLADHNGPENGYTERLYILHQRDDWAKVIQLAITTFDHGKWGKISVSVARTKGLITLIKTRSMQSSSCTHIIANGGLSGSKTQKFLNGQGGRGASRRAKVVKIECGS
jgi:hypothetical protein